jgi:type VI secretion system secreted protein Hcp
MTLAIVGMAANNAQAASTYFLKIGDIKGESTDKAHKDWIDISSFSWGISNTGSVGAGGGGSAGKAIISPLSWTQELDSSVSPLYLGVASGAHYSKATLDVQATGTKSPGTYFKMEFNDVMLTSLNISGAGDQPFVSGSLVYSKLTMTYLPQKPDGSLGSPIIGGWDLKAGAAADAFFGSPDVMQGLALAQVPPSSVPVPAAAWLFGSGLLGLIGFARRKASAKNS